MKKKKLSKTKAINAMLIAPCGMNCRLCRAYIRDKKGCPGCFGDDSLKLQSCVTCRIKNCDSLEKNKLRFCFSCESFPCERLKNLDKRYRTKYGMSMIDNLEKIKNDGIVLFIKNEKERWTCPECNEIICVHNPGCLSCGYKWC